MSFIAREMISVLLLCSLLTITVANPLGSTVERLPDTGSNPFDGGQINSCVTLNVENLSELYCSNFINYSVPAYVAAISPILFSEIRSIHDGAGARGACSTALKEVLCRQKFPRCQQQGQSDQVFIEQTYIESCEQRLRAECGDATYNGLRTAHHVCGFPNVTERVDQMPVSHLPASPCKPIAEYDFNLQACHNVIDTTKTMVTPWMFEVMKQKDAVVHSELRSNDFLSDEICRRRWTAYHCQSVGRCNSDGTRAELVNNMEECELLLGCFDHEISDRLADDGSIPCSLWPNRPLYPSVEPSSSPSSSVDEIVPTTLSSPKVSWPSRGDLTLGPVDAASSLVSTKALMCSLTLLTLLAVSCLL